MQTHSVLLVDDDLLILKSIGPFLESLGYHVTTVESGEDAIELLTRSTFDLIITDLMMGEVGGYQVLETRKKLKSETMFIILTGHTDTNFIVNAFRFGADDYLIKPCEPEEMQFRVERCLEKLEIKRKTKQLEESLRESEERFRAITATALDSIFCKDINRRYTYVNPSMIQLLDCTEADLIGKVPEEVFDKEDVAIVKEVDERTLNGESISEVRSFSIAGKSYTLHTIQVPLYDSVGNIMGINGIVRDISKRKLLEEELLKVKKLESLGVLAGGIAHDFNNLMSAVVGYISLARIEMKPGSNAFEYLSKAEKVAMRTKGLTAQLITFSKGGEPIKEIFSICNLIKDSVGSLLKGSDIDIEFIAPDDISPAEVDEDQMKQVFRNIVTNARESMVEKGTINVSCSNADIGKKDALTLKNGKYVKISVEDQGTGIPEENLIKIFDPYFSTKELGAQKGIGLGLSVSDSIVRKHDGMITVESEVGSGSTFHIYLPAVSAERGV